MNHAYFEKIYNIGYGGSLSSSLVICGEDNGANLGKTVEEVEAEEKALSSLTGTNITAYTAENDLPVDGQEFAVKKWETERALDERAVTLEVFL